MRWRSQPEFGPVGFDPFAFPVNNQLPLVRQPRPGSWLFLDLVISYERHDDLAFRRFLDQAE